MTFNSVDSMNTYIIAHCKDAIKRTQEQVYQIINRFVKEYYSEFSPTMYERTYQLYKSLVKSEIKRTLNGYEAEVYFDIERLDYYMKKINGKEYPNKGNGAWLEEKVLTTAAHGSHGGYKSGTAIWDEPLKILNKETYNILKRMLISSGIPLK